MADRNEIDFDFEALETEMYRDCANAFTSLQLDFPDDPFYAYTMHVPEYMGYLSILAYTESSLHASAKEHLQRLNPPDDKVSFEILKDYWRHTCAADNHHKLVDTTSDLLGTFVLRCDALNEYYERELNVGWEPAQRIVESLREEILEVCQRVMIRLDEAKVFELNNRRDNVTLMISHGDNDPRLEIVERLNPERVFKRYVKEYEAYKAAFTAIYGYVPDWIQ